MDKNRFSEIERLGVNEIERIFLGDFRWIPRTIYQTDIGIDMNVEVVEDGIATGQLIAIQIKSGESYFSEESHGNIIYRGSFEHLEYWLNHCLPVIIVLHNPKTKLTIWQEIKEDNVKKTSKGWKIGIPKAQTLSVSYKKELLNINKLPLYLQRFQRLTSDKKIMKYIDDGGILVIEIEKWINKTSGKAIIKIYKVINEEDILISEVGYYQFREVSDLQVLFPWANFKVDEEYYTEQEEDEFLSQYGIWDPEEKRFIGAFEDFGEHRENYPKIRGLEDGSGEILFYRLFFTLNDFGKSFLEINNYVEGAPLICRTLS